MQVSFSLFFFKHYNPRGRDFPFPSLQVHINKFSVKINITFVTHLKSGEWVNFKLFLRGSVWVSAPSPQRWSLVSLIKFQAHIHSLTNNLFPLIDWYFHTSHQLSQQKQINLECSIPTDCSKWMCLILECSVPLINSTVICDGIIWLNLNK